MDNVQAFQTKQYHALQRSAAILKRLARGMSEIEAARRVIFDDEAEDRKRAARKERA